MKRKKNGGMMDYMSCCMKQVGVVHVIAGVGVGFLLVQYAGLTDLALWGWVLVVIGVLAHFVGNMD